MQEDDTQMDGHSESQTSRDHRASQDHPPTHHGQTGATADMPTKQRAPGAGNPGNFANNREKAVEAGRRGGQHSHGGGGAGNNPGNFANNRQRAAEAGRKGGMQPRR